MKRAAARPASLGQSDPSGAAAYELFFCEVVLQFGPTTTTIYNWYMKYLYTQACGRVSRVDTIPDPAAAWQPALTPASSDADRSPQSGLWVY